MNISLSVELVNDILAYLSTKPWGEVAQLISAIKAEGDSQVPPPVVVDGKSEEVIQ